MKKTDTEKLKLPQGRMPEYGIRKLTMDEYNAFVVSNLRAMSLADREKILKRPLPKGTMFRIV